MTTDLGTLITAADRWDGMAKEFRDQEVAYRRDVHGISLGGGWQGLSAWTASARFDVTLREYQYAQKEAKAIASLLRDAHTQYTDLKGKLETARREAIAADMKVSDQGVVSYDYEKLSEGEKTVLHHDPDYRQSFDKAVTSWQDRIDNAVKAVNDADKGVEIAFQRAVQDSDLLDGTANGFNGSASGDIEKYEADELADIATRIESGDATPRDIQEARRAFRDNAKDTEFHQTFLNNLGASGTIEFSNALSDLGHSGKDKGLYAGLQGDLANSLAVATKDTGSAFYKKFRADLEKAGTRTFDLDVAGEKLRVGPGAEQQVRGYQSLVTLMQQGDGYSGQFLKDMATDIRAAEDGKQGGNPDIWDLRGQFSGKRDGWFANDPLDGVLGIMSKDPDTATSYLDPGADGKNDNLEYLLTERDWNHVDTSNWNGKVEIAGKDTFDKDVRTGLGLALAAGATGNVPGGEGEELDRHTAAQARVLHDAVNLIDYGHPNGKFGEDAEHPRVGRADEVLAQDDYAALRGPLSQALADYSPDAVDIISGDAPGGRSGKADVYEHGDASQIQNSRSSLIRMMRGVSEADDTTNFERIYHAQQGYMSEELMGQDFPNVTAATNEARKVGEVTGALNAVGGDVKMDIHDDKISDGTDTRFYGYHVGGGLVTGIPVIGDAAQRLVDVSLNNWLAGVQAEEGALSKEELSRGNDIAQDNLDRTFDAWGEERRMAPETTEAAAGEARQSYVDGRQIAYEALRSRT
ncbi:MULTISPECIES: DUF6571 family protein [Streptomyces]|uniref:DUF6571 domain-containing protein n=2 Tax=Streptomyces TaxID=1883 RepID=A0A3R7ESX4_9ACTN|nr:MULTISPECIES: DUF6571 family protein [Streptomyces]KNE84369.1 hypothetical protein ADZ36_00670 [Streptomyces fradiae]OFA58619.1 hypothetical protein BEN35_03460 [Streptomyces fradiae]PQM22270.1 hypothetical protein Sfr7A_17840 [Streptomyces xinghaiensis]RKM95523.1 hypothetical protein SFRA_014965 [Streptomyces xinghaiensis]RNC73109.1 hypothetical protein DC095_017390 [Streptomyces xinghaiensis]